MKLTPRLKKNLRIATPFILAFMLALAILPGAVLAQPPDNPGTGGPNNGPPANTPPTATPSSSLQGSPSSSPGQGPNSGPPANPTPTATAVPVATATPDSTVSAHPSAPFTPPADCIVAHAATPAQLCPIAGGLQYYFIGADGSSQQGPWISPFSDLAIAGAYSLYSGANPMSGKSVTITYLAAENKIRISTFYPDTMYDTDKPYNFTVDAGNNVSHENW